MRKWTDDIDPTTIPDEVIATERGRRNSEKRKIRSGGSVWAQHRPGYSRCKCERCNARRAAKK